MPCRKTPICVGDAMCFYDGLLLQNNKRFLQVLFSITSISFFFSQKGQANYDKLVGSSLKELRMSDVRQMSRMSTTDFKNLYDITQQGGNETSTTAANNNFLRGTGSYFIVKVDCGVPFLYYSKDQTGLIYDFGRILAKCP